MDRKKTIYYKMAKKFCNKYGEVEDTKYVAMFLDMMAFQIFETLLILGVASVLGIFYQVLITMVGFLLFRVGHPGIHSSSRKWCVIYSLTLLIGVGALGSLFTLWHCLIFGGITGILFRKKV